MSERKDITSLIGDLYPDSKIPEWPMYSYSRPAYQVWQAIAEELYAAGWTDEMVQEWLQSKHPRWALDGALGDALRDASKMLGRRYAVDHREDVLQWVIQRKSTQ